jgi:hypothetical protein
MNMNDRILLDELEIEVARPLQARWIILAIVITTILCLL